MSSHYQRRMLTIPVFLLFAVVSVLTAPFAYAAAFVADRFSNPSAYLRGLAWVHLYVFLENGGVITCAWLRLRERSMSREAWLLRHHWLERWWGGLQFDAAIRLFRLRVQTVGEEVLREGPYILLSRHVSILDNLIPLVFAGRKNDIRIRWVLNRRLLKLPAVDILGHRLPNVFVDTRGRRPFRDLRRVAALGRDLGPRDAVVIYPEGTLYSPAKRERGIARLRSRLRRRRLPPSAASFEHVLPPEFGGVLTLLRAAPGVDVVFCAHTGLEDALNRPSILRGGLNDHTLRVHFWRVPADQIPQKSSERRAWLLEQWAEIDRIAGGGSPRS